MGIFDGILICTDLDGTLLRNDKSISRENIEAINYFMKNGGLFTFITGRMPYYSSKMYNTIQPNAPFGCINGGGLYDHRKMEYVWVTEPLDRAALTLVEAVENAVSDVGIQVSTLYKTYFSRYNEAMIKFREVAGLPDLRLSYKDVTEPIGKIIFSAFEEENIKKIESCLKSHPLASRFSFIRSERTLYEILPKGINKGTVLLKMSELLGIDQRKTVAVGDYNNDIGMLLTAGVGIAVANATPEAKAAAKHITVSNEEHAIARIISDIEEGIIKM